MNAVLIALALAGGVEDHFRPRQFRIDVEVLQGDPLGSKAEGTVKVLAAPALGCMSGQPACFLAGTNTPVLRAGKIEYRLVGAQIKFTATHRPDGQVKLDLEMTVSQRDPQTGGLRSETRELGRVVKPGEKLRIRIAAASAESQTWAEVTVVEVPRGK